MKKIFIIVLVLFSLFSCSKEENNKLKKYYKTVTVGTGIVTDDISYVAYTDSFSKVNLSAKMGGKITNIYVSEGDKVKKGQLLAQLDGSEAKSGYSSVGNIIASLEELKKSTSNMFDDQILGYKNKLKQAETGKDIASIGLEGTQIGKDDLISITKEQLLTVKSQIKQAETGKETAIVNQKNTKEILFQKENDLYTSSKNINSSSLILSKNIITFLDQLFGVTDENDDKNDAFENYLGAKNTGLKKEVEKGLLEVIKLKKEVDEYQFDINKKDEIILNLNKHKVLQEKTRDVLKNAFIVVDSSVESSNFSASKIQTYKTNITTFQTQVETLIMSTSGTMITGIKGTIDNIANFKKEKTMQLEMIEKQIKQADDQIKTLNQTYKQYESQLKGKISEVETKGKIAKKQQEIAKSQIEELKIGIETIKKQKIAKLREIDAKIKEAKAKQNEAGVMIGNSKIYSPIDGIIIKKIGEVGQVTGGGMPVLVVAKNDDIKVNIYISEEVSTDLKIGDKVQVEIEGIEKQVTGSITKFLSLKDKITKKVGIEIKLKNNQNIKIGTYSKVYLNSGDKSGIVIPNNAIVGKFMIPGVYRKTNSKKIEFNEIKIIKQNDNFSMVEGVSVNDKIISEGKENLYDGEIIE